MKYNNLPGTNLKVSSLSLGTMMFGGQTNETDSLKILDYAIENGVNFWDTADIYNQGESEKIVGKALKNRRDDIILATKVGYPVTDKLNKNGLSRRYIISALKDSLKRLDTDYIDIYYMHAPDYETSLEESLETMSNLVKSGLVRYIGISNYASWQVADMLAICDKHGYVAPIISQNIYNALLRDLEAELIPCLTSHKMGLTVFNPIAGGFLSGKYNTKKIGDNTRFANSPNYVDRYWTEGNFNAIEKLTETAEKNNMTILKLAMKWCAEQPGITSVISGVSKLEQLKQNIEALEGEPLSSDILNIFDEVWHSIAGVRFAYNR